ncbi:hypothetical protein AB3S75_001112 [Citrus x aurantiifolia]
MGLKQAKSKPVEVRSPLGIHVLMTNGILTAGFSKRDRRVWVLKLCYQIKATMEHTLIPALDALNRKDVEGVTNLLRRALQVLLARVVNIVILASNDTLDLLPPDDPLLNKCIDPMDALVCSQMGEI